MPDEEDNGFDYKAYLALNIEVLKALGWSVDVDHAEGYAFWHKDDGEDIFPPLKGRLSNTDIWEYFINNRDDKGLEDLFDMVIWPYISEDVSVVWDPKSATWLVSRVSPPGPGYKGRTLIEAACTYFVYNT